MQALLPKCRASVHHFGCTVAGKATRSKDTKPAKSHLFTQEHFLSLFCNANITDLFGELHPISAQNYFLACYVVSLKRDKPISGTRVQSSTIENYISMQSVHQQGTTILPFVQIRFCQNHHHHASELQKGPQALQDDNQQNDTVDAHPLWRPTPDTPYHCHLWLDYPWPLHWILCLWVVRNITCWL